MLTFSHRSWWRSARLYIRLRRWLAPRRELAREYWALFIAEMVETLQAVRSQWRIDRAALHAAWLSSPHRRRAHTALHRLRASAVGLALGLLYVVQHPRATAARTLEYARLIVAEVTLDLLGARRQLRRDGRQLQRRYPSAAHGLRLTGSALRNVIGVSVALPALVMLLAPRFTGADLRVVLTGSMEPLIARGALVVALPVLPETVEIGDVILFRQPDDPERIIVHRVVAVAHEPQLAIETRGDANNGKDPWTLRGDEITGRLWFSAPALGYGVEFARSPAGFVIFLVLPALVILSSEVRLWYRYILYGEA